MNRIFDYKSIYENSPDMGAFIAPVTGKILACNPMLIKQLGYEEEEILQMNVIDLYNKTCVPLVKENLKAFSENKPVIHSELKLKKKNGDLMFVTLKFMPIKDDEGDILYSNAVWRDISDLKLAQKALQEEKEKVQRINEKVNEKNAIIELKNKNFTDSITYAKRIQRAILPNQAFVDTVLPNSFVMLKPKDIVSGDFYWFHEKEDLVMFAAVDSTGHGVPGAFMSMIGASIFSRVVYETGISDPCAILDQIKNGVVEALHQEDRKTTSDGMDAALCVFNKKTYELRFAGANNPVCIIRKRGLPLYDIKHEEKLTSPTIKDEQKDLFEIKGNKQPLGYYLKEHVPFKGHSVQLQKGDTVYVFSDGFADQFGGEKGKKYLYKRFKQLLLKSSYLPISEQKKALEEELKSWKNGRYEQTDDICIIGMEV